MISKPILYKTRGGAGSVFRHIPGADVLPGSLLSFMLT